MDYNINQQTIPNDYYQLDIDGAKNEIEKVMQLSKSKTIVTNDKLFSCLLPYETKNLHYCYLFLFNLFMYMEDKCLGVDYIKRILDCYEKIDLLEFLRFIENCINVTFVRTIEWEKCDRHGLSSYVYKPISSLIFFKPCQIFFYEITVYQQRFHDMYLHILLNSKQVSNFNYEKLSNLKIETKVTSFEEFYSTLNQQQNNKKDF